MCFAGFEQVVIKNEPVLDLENEMSFHEAEGESINQLKVNNNLITDLILFLDLQQHVSDEFGQDQFTIVSSDPFEGNQY